MRRSEKQIFLNKTKDLRSPPLQNAPENLVPHATIKASSTPVIGKSAGGTSRGVTDFPGELALPNGQHESAETCHWVDPNCFRFLVYREPSRLSGTVLCIRQCRAAV